MCLATRCNANSHFIFVIATDFVSCQNLIVIDQLLTNFQDNLCIQGYLIKVSPQGVTCL